MHSRKEPCIHARNHPSSHTSKPSIHTTRSSSHAMNHPTHVVACVVHDSTHRHRQQEALKGDGPPPSHNQVKNVREGWPQTIHSHTPTHTNPHQPSNTLINLSRRIEVDPTPDQSIQPHRPSIQPHRSCNEIAGPIHTVTRCRSWRSISHTHPKARAGIV